MESLDFLVALERETESMQAAAAAADLDSGVPTCPGWTVRDLVIHTGQVHRHKSTSVRDSWTSGAPPWPDGPDGDVLVWFDEGIDDMLTVFRQTDLDAQTWTWCDHDHTVEWWVRRMAHETLIHGADAVIAIGGTPEVDESLAEDGIEEVLFEMIVGAPEWAELTERNQIVAVVTPDRRWTLRTASWEGTSPNTVDVYVDVPAVVLIADAEEPDGQIVGSPAELNLWLWGRGDLPAGAVTGDAALADLVRSIAAEATQ
jgi:uncharacterized protein (TIGR03083 family)